MVAQLVVVAELVEASSAFSITTFSPPCSLNKVPASGNTVQPTLPCWVVPTAGSLCISYSALSKILNKYNFLLKSKNLAEYL